MAKRSLAEIEEAFSEELDNLESSCDRFRSGRKGEASRIATSIYKLVNDKRNNLSFFSQLRLKEEVYFLSCVEFWDGYVHPRAPMAMINFPSDDQFGENTSKLGFSPPDYFGIKPGYSLLNFEKWWHQGVMSSWDGNVFSRRLIVCTLRDKQGAHFDPDREPVVFHAALRGLASGMEYSIGDGPWLPMPGSPVLVTLWFIGQEILATARHRTLWTRDRDPIASLRSSVSPPRMLDDAKKRRGIQGLKLRASSNTKGPAVFILSP